MNLLSAKFQLLKQYGAMVIALRRIIPGAPKSMHTVVNPTLNTELLPR